MSTVRSVIPCMVRTESCKFYPPTILCLIPKQKGNHQILKKQKLQSLGTGLIRLRNTDSDRHRNTVDVVYNGVGSGSPFPPDNTHGLGSWKCLAQEFFWNKLIWGILIYFAIQRSWKDNCEQLKLNDKFEAVTDIVEKVADYIGNHLPKGKHKDALEFVEDMAEDTADGAYFAGKLIDKVEHMVDEEEEKV